jgi:chaperonin GroES
MRNDGLADLSSLKINLLGKLEGGCIMKFRPLQDWVVIEQDSTEEKSKGGIYFPESSKEKTQTGNVVAIGEGRFQSDDENKWGKKSKEKKEKHFVKTVLKPGQHVFFEKYGSSVVEIDKKEFLLIRESDVLGYLE